MTEEEGAPLDIKFQQRFSKNLISNVVYFVLNVIIGLALVPFFLDTLGIAAYGLIPLATSITSYVTLLIDGLNHAIVRYLTIDLQQGNEAKANQTFNSATFGTLRIIICLIPIIILIAWIAPEFFNIGDSSKTDVFILFSMVLGSVLIRTWNSNFMAILFAYNRLDYRNYVNGSNLLIQVGLIVSLFILFSPSLVYVGLAYIIASLTTLFISMYLSHHICPFLKLSPTLFSWEKFKNMGNMGFWVILDLVGLALNANIALILVNMFVSDIAASEYALILTWSTLLMGVSGLITNVLTPKIYNYYARGDKQGLINFSLFAMKCMGVIMAPIIGLVYIYTPELFSIWLHTDKYSYLVPLLWIVTFPIIIRVQIAGITSIAIGYNKVIVPALYSIGCGILNIILSYFLSISCGLGLYGIAIGGCIAMIIFTGICAPIYMAYVLHISYFTYVKCIIKGIGYFIIFLIIGTLISYICPFDPFLKILIAGGLAFIMYMSFALNVIMKKNERKKLRTCLPQSLCRYIPSWLL